MNTTGATGAATQAGEGAALAPEAAPTAADAPLSLSALRWRCRRGLLENDLALAAFLDTGHAGLDAAGRRAFERLLEFSDAELLGMLLGQAECRDPELRPVVRAIRAAAKPDAAGSRPR